MKFIHFILDHPVEVGLGLFPVGLFIVLIILRDKWRKY